MTRSKKIYLFFVHIYIFFLYKKSHNFFLFFFLGLSFNLRLLLKLLRSEQKIAKKYSFGNIYPSTFQTAPLLAAASECTYHTVRCSALNAEELRLVVIFIDCKCTINSSKTFQHFNPQENLFNTFMLCQCICSFFLENSLQIFRGAAYLCEGLTIHLLC